MSMDHSVPNRVRVSILGGSGYVGGELARRQDQETVYEVAYRYDDGEVGRLTLRSKPGVAIGQRVRVYVDQLEPA